MAWDIVLEDKSAEKGGEIGIQVKVVSREGAAIMSFSHYNPMIIVNMTITKVCLPSSTTTLAAAQVSSRDVPCRDYFPHKNMKYLWYEL